MARRSRSVARCVPIRHGLEVVNGIPGLTNLSIEVNDRTFELAGLRDGETRQIDMGAALSPGQGNVITVTPRGRPGGSAWVLVADQPWQTVPPSLPGRPD